MNHLRLQTLRHGAFCGVLTSPAAEGTPGGSWWQPAHRRPVEGPCDRDIRLGQVFDRSSPSAAKVAALGEYDG